MDGGHEEIVLLIIVQNAEQLQVTDHLGRQVLQNEALVLEAAHRKFHRRQPVGAGQIRKPLAVLFGRVLAHPPNVLIHGKAQGVGIDTTVVGTVETRLVHNAGVRGQEFQHEAVSHQPFVVQIIHQCVMPEGGPTLVHDLGLTLRVEILGDLADDAHHFTLPGLQQGGVLFDEVEDVFLGLCGEAREILFVVLARAFRDRAPQIVDLLLQMLLAVLHAATFFFCRNRVGPLVAIDAVVHQRVARVEQILDRIDPVALFALHDVLLGEDQVIDDRTCVGPGAEQVVALEKAVMPVAGVGHDERLHADGVLFHQIGDARVGVDDDLVGQTHLSARIGFFRTEEVFAVGPMVITQRHADRRVGVHHLLGGDHLNLVGVSVQRITFGDPADFPVVGLDQFERPL